VIEDGELIESARNQARELIERDPHLGSPEHGPLLREVHRVYEAAWKWVSAG